MDDRGFLAALQLSDSLFPSGAFTLSSGLETMVADGVVAGPAQLAEALELLLDERLGWCDLPATLAAHDAWHAHDAAAVELIDGQLSAAKLPREEREGSERTGRRLALEVNRLLSDPVLEKWLSSVAAGRSPGNLAVAQGVAGAALGIDRRQTAVLAGYNFAAAFMGAAMRLTRIGHGSVQALLLGARAAILRAVDLAEQGDWASPAPSTPQADIASARHEVAEARMFGS